MSDAALAAITTTKVLNEAYGIVRQRYTRGEWLELAQDEKVRICTEVIKELLILHSADQEVPH